MSVMGLQIKSLDGVGGWGVPIQVLDEFFDFFNFSHLECC